MTASEPAEATNEENGIEDIALRSPTAMEPISLDENFKPDIVGGHDLCSMRAHFDQNDKNIIVASNRQLFYYCIETCELVGKANITSSKLKPDERIVASEILGSSMYVFTNKGRTFIWSLETRDWINELALPIDCHETLQSCKLLSKRQYIYNVFDEEQNVSTLYYSMSRSERERPKQREAIGQCTEGEQSIFDIGCMVDPDDAMEASKSSRDKSSQERCLVYINGSNIHFQRVAMNEKFSASDIRLKVFRDLTCVKANPRRPMVAAGDTLGRIYLFTGEFRAHKINRTQLHWHTLPVNDLCFSSTGNTLFSVGGESGCVVAWDLTQNNLTKKQVYPRLGMPIRFINCSGSLNQLILSFEDNELQFMDTSGRTRPLKTFTRRTSDMYRQNNHKALRINTIHHHHSNHKSVGLQWHSKTDTVVTNGKTGWLQFYSPRAQAQVMSLNFLKSNILSLESEAKVIPSDITKATLTVDGNWLAFYETRESEDSFPDLKLHIWQRSALTNRWMWIQTADRLHTTNSIVELRYSPDGQFLISVSEDGTFHVLHRICLDAKGTAKSNSKQMYAKGFVGNVPIALPAMATFSHDSSVMAMSLKNDTTLIWMIVDPYKLVYECQLNQLDSSPNSPNHEDNTAVTKKFHTVIGLQFGHHKLSQSSAPLCEVRTNSIRIWNILNPQETMECNATDIGVGEFTASSFDLCQDDGGSADHFAVSSRTNLILLFELSLSQNSRSLRPLIAIDATLPFSSSRTALYYTNMCFLRDPILEIDQNCHSDQRLVKLLNRLCLMNNHQELIGVTDKLTLERQSCSNSCNAIKTCNLSELQSYFANKSSDYSKESDEYQSKSRNTLRQMTDKQRQIRSRLDVQKMLKDLLIRIPSQNLPNMEILGPMILDKLV